MSDSEIRVHHTLPPLPTTGQDSEAETQSQILARRAKLAGDIDRDLEWQPLFDKFKTQVWKKGLRAAVTRNPMCGVAGKIGLLNLRTSWSDNAKTADALLIYLSTGEESISFVTAIEDPAEGFYLHATTGEKELVEEMLKRFIARWPAEYIAQEIFIPHPDLART